MIISLGPIDKAPDYTAWDAYCMKYIGRTIPIVAIKNKPELSRCKGTHPNKRELKLLGFLEAAKSKEF